MLRSETVPVVAKDLDGPVCRLRLNRPAKLNALDGATLRELHDHFTLLADAPEIAVVVLSGEGRAFSAGADLSAAGQSEMTWAERRHAFGAWQRLLDLLERIPQVTVASIHGHCIGGAALLAVACDIRIGADDLRVQIPELAIGIPLTWAGIPRLVREVGLPLARDLVMTGRTLDGPAALASGFVQRMASRSDLDTATTGLVAELLAMPSGPLAITRSMFSALSRDALGAAAWADADILAWSGAEPESRAAAAAYVTRLTKPDVGGPTNPG
jgi:enoyl-CoA hydratase/carnithine racemase